MLREKIKQKRKERGYSQDYMANQLGITTSAYSKIERGETRIDIDRLKQLSETLETDVIDLLSDENVVIAYNGDHSVNGYHATQTNHIDEDQRKDWNRMFEHLEGEVTTLRQKNDQLLKLVEKLTDKLGGS